MKNFAIIFVIAVIVEALIEYGTTVFEMLSAKQYKKAVKQLCAITLCIFICFMCRADVFTLLGMDFALPWFGVVLTGIFGSRGSNYLSDIIKRIQTMMSGSAPAINDYLPDGAQTSDEMEETAG